MRACGTTMAGTELAELKLKLSQAEELVSGSREVYIAYMAY